MIGIDFSFLSEKESETGIICGSISIFLTDILRGFSSLGMSSNFSLIVSHNCVGFISKHFPEYTIVPVGRICTIGKSSIGLPYRYRRPYKKIKAFEKTVLNNDISNIWFPWMVPEEIHVKRLNYVGTCHDLKMRKSNSDASIQAMFSNAKHTVVLSDFIKNEVVNHYDISKDSISVIPNAISLADESADTKPVSSLQNTRFILDVNAYGEEKNTLTLLKAFKRISDKTDLSLVLCGGYKDNEYFDLCRQFVNENNLSNRVHMFYAISEAEKNWLFKNCELFVTPSKNEGFGRTPIEAALCMKPVISTQATSLEEVTMGLLHYYNEPENDEMLSEKILELIEKPDESSSLKRIRDEYYKKYSSKAVAEQYLEVFDKLHWLNL